MGYKQEISSIFHSRNYDSRISKLGDKYKDIYGYYSITPEEYFQYLSVKSDHPLSVRFHKLCRYVSRLTNLSVDSVKKSVLRVLKAELDRGEVLNEYHFSKFVYLVLGQSLKDFLNTSNREYDLNHVIYETIVVAVHEGLKPSAIAFRSFVENYIKYTSDLPSTKKLLNKEYYLIHRYVPNPELFYGDIHLFCNLYHIIDLVRTFDVDPRYPLAESFRREFLVYSKPYYDDKEEFYSQLERVFIEFRNQLPSSVGEDLLKKYLDDLKVTVWQLNKGLNKKIYYIFKQMDILPESVVNTIKKFVIYASGLLDNIKSFPKPIRSSY